MAASAIQELIQDVDNQLNGSITIVGKEVTQLYIFHFWGSTYRCLCQALFTEKVSA
jgi:hypothetical protein